MQINNTKLKIVANSGDGDKEECEIRRVYRGFKCFIT